ncbi:hypothetical protein TeGR_g1683 [Tetraparma gracilis]|uniref:Uncharacterized protein n=1 Tax=Tetraparma gracilis TaxID=2962635 RepID=A0ABQ6N7L0_9STRA|nr:hypothetical protein TeGR_g1683 [Tetraparma gracilis]
MPPNSPSSPSSPQNSPLHCSLDPRSLPNLSNLPLVSLIPEADLSPTSASENLLSQALAACSKPPPHPQYTLVYQDDKKVSLVCPSPPPVSQSCSSLRVSVSRSRKVTVSALVQGEVSRTASASNCSLAAFVDVLSDPADFFVRNAGHDNNLPPSLLRTSSFPAAPAPAAQSSAEFDAELDWMGSVGFATFSSVSLSLLSLFTVVSFAGFAVIAVFRRLLESSLVEAECRAEGMEVSQALRVERARRRREATKRAAASRLTDVNKRWAAAYEEGAGGGGGEGEEGDTEERRPSITSQVVFAG